MYISFTDLKKKKKLQLKWVSEVKMHIQVTVVGIGGTRNHLLPITIAVLQNIWGSETSTDSHIESLFHWYKQC